MPSGAVASVLENAGKKNTTFFERVRTLFASRTASGNRFPSLVYLHLPLSLDTNDKIIVTSRLGLPTIRADVLSSGLPFLDLLQRPSRDRSGIHRVGRLEAGVRRSGGGAASRSV